MRRSRFHFLLVTLLLLMTAAGLVQAQGDNTPQPTIVAIAGTIQTSLGCGGDWQTDCEDSFLTYSASDDVWIASWDIPAGEYEYKVALNGTWDENYGANAVASGDNIPLVVESDTRVTFWYDHKTHLVADSVNNKLALLAGTIQNELGCVADANDGDWEPACMRTLLQDIDGDGVYTFETVLLPAGDYEFKVTVNRSWDENYGEGGVGNGPNIPLSVPGEGHLVSFAFNYDAKEITFEVSAEPVATPEEIEALKATLTASVPPPGDLSKAKAYWVARDTIVWDIERAVASYKLVYSADADLALVEGEISGGEELRLRYNSDGLSEDVLAKFPHLAGMSVFTLDEEDLDKVPDILKGQYAVVMAKGSSVMDATALQIPGVVDDLYTYDGDLGVIFDGDVPTLKVWAPTARSVKLHLFDSPRAEATVYDMEADADSGVWSITGEPDWNYKFYLYEVEVFALETGMIEHNLVTDPYSFSLATNSTHSQIVDLYSDLSLMPPGWANVEKPELEAPEDVVLYELHVRDFSMSDPAVPDGFKGTYMAFTVEDSYGVQHLSDLAAAGLTHLHLLPTFDIATINEDKSQWVDEDWDTLAGFAPDSEEQQAILTPSRDEDGFNWGYDPYHYTVPEGSYATNPNGPTRILQYRRMVQSLNENVGLRVVMDVVYNHTNGHGQGQYSVLDKVVPGYYYRLNNNGAVYTSSCCPNTATEHNMMRKLMVDSVVTWATAYKVDGFRFDLMGLHMLDDMVAVREALDALTLEEDGVDGKSIYVYGEGWNHGELADNACGVSASQLDMGGLGIGTFNDRIRDFVRGGSPFGGQQEQGFINGLYTNPNGITPGTEEEQLASLLAKGDGIRIALAGNLRDFEIIDAAGETVAGGAVDYNGQPSGYTLDPQEHIAYVSAHDNETLFDKIQYAAPAGTSSADRARMQQMGISFVTLSQGVPFLHAGVDMLRSKDMDRDSYNSGDWFNRLDFTYESNNWGVGLPPAEKNDSMYDVIQPLLADPDMAVSSEDIVATVVHTQEMLKIRKSSVLFRLRTAEEIMARVAFHNTGPEQVPGLIVMSISDMGDLENLDPDYAMVVVLFNATGEEITFTADAVAGLDLALHPVQQVSADPIVQGSSFEVETGTFTVPAYTTAVFVLAE